MDRRLIQVPELILQSLKGGHLDKLHMSDSLLFINFLGGVIVAVESL